MGYAGTMETWEPQLVDTLALRNRVVVFDNAGIGGTKALPSPLTVDAMANQTSALISALGLGRADVLGWSMGGMIAQALAVLHPGQVRRLVLCAMFPGEGTVIPPQAKINDLTNGNGLRRCSRPTSPWRWPCSSAGAESYADAEAASARSSPPREAPRSPASTAPTGRTEDLRDHRADAGRRRDRGPARRGPQLAGIARLIPAPSWSSIPTPGTSSCSRRARRRGRGQAFLSGAARQACPAVIRADFRSGRRPSARPGNRGFPSSRGCRRSLLVRDQQCRDVQPDRGPDRRDRPAVCGRAAELDARLLSDGATGRVAAAITAFVTDDERLATDILALPG